MNPIIVAIKQYCEYVNLQRTIMPRASSQGGYRVSAEEYAYSRATEDIRDFIRKHIRKQRELECSQRLHH